MKLLFVVLVAVAVAAHAAHNATAKKQRLCVGDCQLGAIDSRMTKTMQMKWAHYEKCRAEGSCPLKTESVGATPCVDGKAGEFECKGIDMLSFVSIEDLGSKYDASDIWGWTDPETGHEIVMIGVMDGTSFVDVTKPSEPVVLGFLPQSGTNIVIWRDVKVYKNHAYIVAESRNHGMQIYDLTQFRSVDRASIKKGAPPKLRQTAFYDEFGSSHNIVINEESGYAYSVGTKTCSGGLHMVDIKKPLEPTYAGCFSADGYTHDAQCVIYNGPDAKYRGKEICFNYNEDTLTIVDVTEKNPSQWVNASLRKQGSGVMISRTGYEGAFYTHQGWFLEDNTHLLMNDELDEVEGTNKHTRTMIWDASSLEAPILKGSFYSTLEAIDHNLYIKKDRAFCSNYCAGLRVLDTTTASRGAATEVAYFDLAPKCNTVKFEGTWSNYPYFASGTIAVSSIERGLFLLKMNEKSA